MNEKIEEKSLVPGHILGTGDLLSTQDLLKQFGGSEPNSTLGKSHQYWENLISSYFKAKGFVGHQIDSYNMFIEVGIQKILTETGPIVIKTSSESRGGEATYTIEFGTISLKKPIIREHDGTTNILYPQEARHRNLTYHASIYCDISVSTTRKTKNGIIETTVRTSKEQLGYIPIMVRSKFCLLNKKTEKEAAELGECIYDEGGYFIINGNEKVVIAQERMPNNIVYCFYKKPPSKIVWQAEIRSQFEYHIKTTSTLYLRIFSKGSRSNYTPTPTFTDIDGIRAQITYIKQDIPIMFLFYALGYTSKNSIIDIITNARIPTKEDYYYKNILKFLRCSFDEAEDILQEEETAPENLQDFALDYIGKKGSTIAGSRADRIKYATQIFNKELLPHLSLEYNDIFKEPLQLAKTKAHFIGYIINKLYLCYVGIDKENDRDHLANKRIELTGNLLGSLFKGIFKRLHKEAKVNLTKTIEASNTFDLMNSIKSKSITNDLKYAISTGNWGRQTGGTPPKTGVAQQLNRLTFASTLSHLRRLNTPLNREGKQPKPRQLHNTHFGYVCVSPETTVLLANNELKSIKELVEKGDNHSISVVDPKSRTRQDSNIVAFQTFKSNEFNKDIFRLTTKCGRSIVATEDHKFAIQGGEFKELGNIKINDKVLIMPTPINKKIYSKNLVTKELLNRKTFLECVQSASVVTKKCSISDAIELENNGFLPLMKNDPRIITLARFIGYSLTDGHVNSSAEFYMGCEEDGNSLRDEARSLGIGSVTDGREHRSEHINKITGKVTKYVTWRVNIAGSLARLILALGAIAGKKVTKEVNVPEFILSGDLEVKEAFLSAVFGGDGSALWYTGNRISPPNIRLSKRCGLIKNLENFLNDIKNMLLEFKIETSDVSDYTPKDSDGTTLVRGLLLSRPFNNLLNFNDYIGFKWCKQKQNKMRIVGEYIRYCQIGISKREKNKELALSMHSLGTGPTEIADKLDVNKTYLPETSMKIAEFISDTQADTTTGTLYDKIVKIEKVPIEECPVVMDLTTESDIHTFVSNGFVTHNCPCETPEGAGCTDINSKVLLSDGSLKSIKHLENTYSEASISTVDIKSRKPVPTDVLAFQNLDSKKFGKRILKLTTVSGRSITVTEDHGFAVQNDTFSEAGLLKINDRVLVRPTPIDNVESIDIPIKQVLDRETFINRVKVTGIVADKTTVSDANELEAAGLLPLMNNDKRLKTLASLVGYCNTDGNISKVAGFYMGCEEDATALTYAAYEIGVGKITDKGERKTTQTLTDGRVINHTTWFITMSGSLVRLLVSLGAVVGNKTKQMSNVPEFISHSSLEVKASYLSAVFGGDGEALSYVENNERENTRWVANPPGFGNTKIESLSENLESYMNGLKELLLEFGIESCDVKEQSSVNHKEFNKGLEESGKETKTKMRFYISSSYSNLLKFADNIGFKWCKHKQNKMQIVSEYVRYCHTYKEETIKDKEVCREMYNSGTGPTEIVQIFQNRGKTISKRRIEHWISNKYETHIPKDYVKWPDYLLETEADFSTGTLYDKISKIEDVTYEECPVVMDLTTESDNHTFVTDGFVTHNCGLLRNLSIMSHVSIGSHRSFRILKRFLKKYGDNSYIEDREMSDDNLYKVFLDGAWVLSVDEATVNLFSQKLKKFRRSLMINNDTSVSLDKEIKELQIFTGGGRCCRPLLVVENLHLLTEQTKDISWIELLSKGIVEYIDVNESEELMIAMDMVALEKGRSEDGGSNLYTHLEVHPSVILGICASIIPFCDHNQSPRNIYQSAMSKQAMGIYASNFHIRFDTLAHVLHYPEKPLVSTKAMKFMRFKELPAGINAIVAIACYGGYNQEDSIIFNQGAIDRGLFRSSFFRTYIDQEKEIVRVGGLMEQFENPNKAETKGIQHGNYDKLGPDGIIEPGSRAVENDIIIGKTTPIATSKQQINEVRKFKKRDVSTAMRPNETGVVDKVLMTTNSDGYKYTKVKMRSIRVPEVGDKLACLTNDHDVLTINGWIPIEKVTLEDKVACLKEGELVYNNPLEVMHYPDYEGDMYEISNSRIDCKVTGKHRMWVSKGKDSVYDFELAKDIVGQTRRYKKDAEWKKSDYFFTLPACDHESNDISFDTPEKMNAWLSLFGLWVAKGKNSILANESIFITDNEKHKEILLKSTKDLGYEYTELYGCIKIINNQLCKYLFKYGNLITKFIPEWCFELSRNQTRQLINGMIGNDMHHYTCSDKLADQLMQLCLHAGWASTRRERDISLKHLPSFSVYITKTNLHPTVGLNEQIEKYTDNVKNPVYCLHVPSEVFYIRRNGKTMWTGNSRHGQIKRIKTLEEIPITGSGGFARIQMNIE
jgi:DNA-directed RNA polymerase beta subunit